MTRVKYSSDIPASFAAVWPSQLQIQAIVSMLKIQIQSHLGPCKEYGLLRQTLQLSW